MASSSSAAVPGVSENVLKDKRTTIEELYTKYEIGETLGTGAFSEVKTATCRSTGERFAVKVIDKAKCKGKENMIQSEVEILKKVKHKNIIRLFDIYESPAKIFLIMELVTGGELFDRIVERGHYTEADAAKIIYDILLGVDYLHEMGICHRDLKPENLLFQTEKEDAAIMISDFGLSKIFQEIDIMKTACGTPGYVAPEVLRRQGYGKNVDIWSIGVITYILLCGYPPFYEENNVELFNQIMKGHYEFDSPYWDNISVEAKNFVSRMLVVDASVRITTKEALLHPFLTENCEAADRRAKAIRAAKHGFSSPYSLKKKTDSEMSNLAPTVKINMQQKILPQKRANASVEYGSKKEAKSHTGSVKSKETPVNKVTEDMAHVTLSHRSAAQSSPILATPTSDDNIHVAANIGFNPLRPKEDQREIEDSGIVASRECVKGKQPDNGHHNNSNSPRNVPQIKPAPRPQSPNEHKASRPVSSDHPQVKDPSFVNAKTYLYAPFPETNKTNVPTRYVNVLSYNIFMRPPGVRNNFSDHKNARLSYFCQHVLPNYDIVALQEMFAYGSSRQNKLISYAKQTGLDYNVTSPSKGLLNGTIDGGLIILSRFPILKHSKITFKKGVYSDRFAAKGALYARVAIDSTHHVHVFTTHLQASYDHNSKITDPDVVARLNQIIAFRHFILQCTADKAPHEPILIMGDLNVNARTNNSNGNDSEEYKYMMHILRGENVYIPGLGWSYELLQNYGLAPHEQFYLPVRDVLKEKYAVHPVTYGDVTDHITKMPVETTLTVKEDYGLCASLDYMLWVDSAVSRPDGKGAIGLDLQNVKVESFAVDGSQDYTHLSDHYGVRCILSVT